MRVISRCVPLRSTPKIGQLFVPLNQRIEDVCLWRAALSSTPNRKTRVCRCSLDCCLVPLARVFIAPIKVADQRSREMDLTFREVVGDHLGDNHVFDARDLKILSSLIANAAEPPVYLKELAQFRASGDWFKGCCFRAVTSAANPFIPGIILSIRLGEAAKQAREGERWKFTDIKSNIEALLLEIFKRLPQTARVFEK